MIEKYYHIAWLSSLSKFNPKAVHNGDIDITPIPAT